MAMSVVHLDEKEISKRITITVEVHKRPWYDLRLRMAVALICMAHIISPTQVEIK